MQKLEKIFENSPTIEISDISKFVIFSDLHLGNGGINDDFVNNSNLFLDILKQYYYPKNYNLVLNGDVEELYKFRLSSIKKKWSNVYEIFDTFDSEKKLFKIFGNHDYSLWIRNYISDYDLYEAIKLKYKDDYIFIFHGHQTAGILERYSKIILFFVKYFLRTISNKPIPLINDKKFKTELVAYKFSKHRKIVSILGHTHRPLFESHSKLETLKNIIDKLIRKYLKADEEFQKVLQEQIKKYKSELEKILQSKKNYYKISGIYNADLVLPCLFNTGAVTGKHGITCIEIKNGKIYLCYWFDKRKSQRYLEYKGVKLKQIDNTFYHKAILKKESLDYIFKRIKLLCC